MHGVICLFSVTTSSVKTIINQFTIEILSFISRICTGENVSILDFKRFKSPKRNYETCSRPGQPIVTLGGSFKVPNHGLAKQDLNRFYSSPGVVTSATFALFCKTHLICLAGKSGFTCGGISVFSITSSSQFIQGFAVVKISKLR